MSTTETAAEAATEVVQAAAKPVAYIAVIIGAAIGVAAIVRKWGASLPLPSYLVDWAGTDDEPEQEEEEE